MRGNDQEKRGRKGITLDDVKRASEAMKEQGRAIGPTNIRLELGRGSYDTIIKHLRAIGRAGKRNE